MLCPQTLYQMDVIFKSSCALARLSKHPPGRKQGHHTVCGGCFGNQLNWPRGGEGLGGTVSIVAPGAGF